MTRRPRARKQRGRSRVGERFTVEVGPVAHGGHCVARVVTDSSADPVETRVVFVRHALPGETVELVVTEGADGDRFWRGDAVTILSPSPDRVEPPCPYAGPDACGGCDFQHVAVPAQRDLKAAVVREQLSRLAKLDLDVVVEAVPGDDHGLHWRTRQRYVSLPGGRVGMRKHRSHEVVPIEECLIQAHEAASHEVLGRAFSVAPDGFWQVHPGAASVLVETVLEMLDPQPGEAVLDLYAGVGLFAAFLGDRTGPGARLVAVEGDRDAARHARRNLPGHADVATGSVDQVLASSYDEPFDLVVLDPPREGARRKVVDQVVDRAPRAVAYVACDPAALARDVAFFAEHGYAVQTLRAFDLFPMTSHLECVALLENRL